MSSAAAKKKIVVCGGNGFLGSRICRAAVARDWDVTSISRSGEPHWPSVSSHSSAPAWSSKVRWHSANILAPETYRQELAGADAVVHSMGILLEADYKGVLTGKESPISGLRRAFSATKRGASRDPLQQQQQQQQQQRRSNPNATDGDQSAATITTTSTTPLSDAVEPGEPDGQLTYELMNRDSALVLAREASAADVPSFAYISAAAGAPILPGRYISTKREAEDKISTTFPRMRSIFIRPGFLYDTSRGFTVPMAAVTYAGFLTNSLTGGNLTWLMGAGGAKPLKADLVADAVVEGLADESVTGNVEVVEIEALANRAWRRGMI